MLTNMFTIIVSFRSSSKYNSTEWFRRIEKVPLCDIGAFLVILFIWINARYESNRGGIDLNENFNCIQQAAYDLIQSDARFIYTIVDIHQNDARIKTGLVKWKN